MEMWAMICKCLLGFPVKIPCVVICKTHIICGRWKSFGNLCSHIFRVNFLNSFPPLLLNFWIFCLLFILNCPHLLIWEREGKLDFESLETGEILLVKLTNKIPGVGSSIGIAQLEKYCSSGGKSSISGTQGDRRQWGQMKTKTTGSLWLALSGSLIPSKSLDKSFSKWCTN